MSIIHSDLVSYNIMDRSEHLHDLNKQRMLLEEQRRMNLANQTIDLEIFSQKVIRHPHISYTLSAQDSYFGSAKAVIVGYQTIAGLLEPCEGSNLHLWITDFAPTQSDEQWIDLAQKSDLLLRICWKLRGGKSMTLGFDPTKTRQSYAEHTGFENVGTRRQPFFYKTI